MTVAASAWTFEASGLTHFQETLYGTMVYTLFTIMAPVFICFAVGYGWQRSGRGYDTNLITQLVTTIGAPCLAFQVLISADVSMQSLSIMAGATMAALLGNGLVAFGVLKLFGQPLRAFVPSLVFGNAGNLGLPLTLLAFGEQGLALAIGVFIIHAVVNFGVGEAIASGKTRPLDILRMPMLWAVIIAVVLRLVGFSVPPWVLETTKLLGGMTIPLMLITLGISLAKIEIKGLGRSLVLACFRLMLGLAMGFSMASLFGLEGLARNILILQLAMPSAVFNYLFAARYNRHPEEVAGIVLLSTLLSFAGLPLLLWYLL